MELLACPPVIEIMKRKLRSSNVRVAREPAPMPLVFSLGTVGALIGLLAFWFSHGV
jgi:hypothetical protein